MYSQKRKRIGIADVAREAGVSRSTVSMALRSHKDISEQTRKKVIAICERLKYRPSHGMAFLPPAPPAHYGLISLKQHDHYFIQSLLDSLSLAGTGKVGRMEVLVISDITNTAQVQQRCLDFAQNVDGVLISGWSHPGLLQALDEKNIPFVILGPFPSDPALLPARLCRSIGFNAVEMGRTATGYLLKHGHTRIGFVAEMMPPFMYNSGWYDGYRVALLEAGLKPIEKLLFLGDGGGTADQCARQVLALPANQRPTAYVLSASEPAKLFLRTLAAHGVIVQPKDTVVGGYIKAIEEKGPIGHPTLARCMLSLAQAGLHRLSLSGADRGPIPGHWNLPFVTRNMPLDVE